MGNEKIYQMDFSKVYHLLVSKAEKKGRTKQEVDEVIRWLTGYSQPELEGMLERPMPYGDFFRDAPELNENRRLIKGVVCGVRVEDIEEPLMQEIRYLDKLVDELARETMPEDANPELESGTKENYLYFTLPMALNYQRNSYKLWEAAKATYLDVETKDVYRPESVIQMPQEDLRDKLLKYKVALQPNKHVEIWFRLCSTFVDRFQGDVRNLFLNNDNSVKKVKEYILANKKSFPYLSGTKILNYWLYVMSQYTDARLEDRQYITVAPDTHVIQASERLGLITYDELEKPAIREKVSLLWEEVFRETERCPIDIHTPLWLWSRGGFKVKVGECDAELS